MQASACRRLAIDERLHAQAGAIHSGLDERFERRLIQLPRRAFDGDLRIRRDVELGAQVREKARQQLRGEQAGRSAAQVDRVHAARQMHAHPIGPGPGSSQIGDQAVHVAGVLAGGIDPRGEVAKGALRAAIGDGEVETERVAGRRRH